MYKKIFMIFILSILLVFTGCGEEKNSTENNSISNKNNIIINDPQKALEEIYKDITIKGVENGDKKFVTETLNIDESYFKKFYIKKTDGKYGVADIYIIEPTQGNSDKIVRALTSFRDQRALQFKDYNIYNSYEITQNAKIITRGDYIIMIMVEDTETAEEILKQYITG